MGLRPTLHHENQLSSPRADARTRRWCLVPRVRAKIDVGASGTPQRCCGLDVHKKTVVACVRMPGRTGAREQQVRTFGTTTAELLALRDWLGG